MKTNLTLIIPMVIWLFSINNIVNINLRERSSLTNNDNILENLDNNLNSLVDYLNVLIDVSENGFILRMRFKMRH